MNTDIRLLTEKELNILRGKALVGHCDRDEQLALCHHITTLEMKLDEAEMEGNMIQDKPWREAFGMEEQ